MGTDLPWCVLLVGKEACLVSKPAEALEITTVDESNAWGRTRCCSQQWLAISWQDEDFCNFRPLTRSSLYLILIDKGKEIQLLSYSSKFPASTAWCHSTVQLHAGWKSFLYVLCLLSGISIWCPLIFALVNHSLLPLSMPLLVVQVSNTDSLHYYHTHLSFRLTSLTFSRCSFIAPPTGPSFHLSCRLHVLAASWIPGASGCALLLSVTLPSPVLSFNALPAGDLTKPWDNFINLFLALVMLALCATARSSVGSPNGCKVCPLMSPG